MYTEQTNWQQSVAAVCIRDGKVLLARHTYGGGKGKLIIPGGYLEMGEMPQDAVKREFMEEVNIRIEPREVIGIRFNTKDWYVVFAADYISGTPRSDGDENSEVVWIPVEEALIRSDIPGLTKALIRCAVQKNGLVQIPYEGLNPPYALFGVKGQNTRPE